jgi:hypothetical protein
MKGIWKKGRKRMGEWGIERERDMEGYERGEMGVANKGLLRDSQRGRALFGRTPGSYQRDYYTSANHDGLQGARDR